jgi:hypothetical protein
LKQDIVLISLLCEYIEQIGYSRHEAIHVMILILMHIIYNAFRNEKGFDKERYKCILVKGRKVKV